MQPKGAGGDLVAGSRERRLTRRNFGRLAAMLAAGSSLPFYNEFTLAQGLSSMRNLPPDAVLLNSNENPMGPCPEAVEAVKAIAPLGGRYMYRETFEFIKLIAKVEGLPESHVAPFAGSSDALHRVVLAFTSPEKCLVTCDPGYEAGERAAQANGAKVIRVPLRKDCSHDVHEMVKADANVGVIYLCNPNNPTGSITRKEDIDYAVANKPPGSIVLIDEAYIHISPNAVPAVEHVAADRDVIILRTFSKLYGMAGLRAGATFARPDLLQKLKFYAAGALPATGMVAAIASLKSPGLIEKRRSEITSIREETAEWLDKKGFKILPSESNCFMVDLHDRPAREVTEGLFKEKVVVGRVWSSMPKHIRVTVGTRDEMAQFRRAFAKVMSV